MASFRLTAYLENLVYLTLLETVLIRHSPVPVIDVIRNQLPNGRLIITLLTYIVTALRSAFHYFSDERYSDKRIFNRCNPSRMFSDNLISSGSLGVSSAAHSQNDAINAARSTDNLNSARPDSIIGIRAAAARNRFNSGEGMGRDLGIRRFYQRPSPLPFALSQLAWLNR